MLEPSLGTAIRRLRYRPRLAGAAAVPLSVAHSYLDRLTRAID